MTLNIALLDRSTIYLSSDFRLASFQRDTSGKWVVVADNSPKIVRLEYRHWSACVTYCGVGMWDSTPTYQLVADWITAYGPGEKTFDEIIELLLAKGSAWTRDIRARLGRFQSHTFIVAGFDNGTPRLSILSNERSELGTTARREDGSLVASSRTPSGTEIFVGGIQNAVSRESRDSLKRLVKKNVDPTVIRNEIAKANARAADSVQANGGISSGCLCYSFDRNHAGVGIAYGKVKGTFVPVRIHSGVNTTQMLEKAIPLGPNVQVRQMVSATSASSDAVAREHIHCEIRFSSNNARPEITAADIGDINRIHIYPTAINRRRTVVGEMRDPVAASPVGFFWKHGADMFRFGTFGGPFSSARDVNNQDVVVGYATDTSGLQRAFIWRDSVSGLMDLGTLGADWSTAKAINDAGVVVGVSQREGGPPNGEGERAFIWDATDGMRPVPDLADCWSRAEDINNDSLVIGSFRRPNQAIGGFAWTKEHGLIRLEAAGRPVFPKAINNSGLMVGECQTKNGEYAPFVWTLKEGLHLLQVDTPFHPQSLDDEGNIVGFGGQGPWALPMMFQPERGLILLPYAHGHNCEARSISNGNIIGSANTEAWKHTHPILWDLGICEVK